MDENRNELVYDSKVKMRDCIKLLNIVKRNLQSLGSRFYSNKIEYVISILESMSKEIK